ncbi:hypothetical protein JHW43_004209 [Diplocarpon mali]|nr:hypothetical protein JHW43_004209 [Diplocarpon mali]
MIDRNKSSWACFEAFGNSSFSWNAPRVAPRPGKIPLTCISGTACWIPAASTRKNPGDSDQLRPLLDQIEVLLGKYSEGAEKNGIKWTMAGRDDMKRLFSNLDAHKSTLDLSRLVNDSEYQNRYIQVRTDTAMIKEETAQIPAGTARLQAQLPTKNSIRRGNSIKLQRYRDDLSSCTETSCGVSSAKTHAGPVLADVGSDSDSGVLEHIDFLPYSSSTAPANAFGFSNGAFRYIHNGRKLPVPRSHLSWGDEMYLLDHENTTTRIRGPYLYRDKDSGYSFLDRPGRRLYLQSRGIVRRHDAKQLAIAQEISEQHKAVRLPAQGTAPLDTPAGNQEEMGLDLGTKRICAHRLRPSSSQMAVGGLESASLHSLAANLRALPLSPSLEHGPSDARAACCCVSVVHEARDKLYDYRKVGCETPELGYMLGWVDEPDATVMLTGRSHDIEMESLDHGTDSLETVSSSPNRSSLDTLHEEDEDGDTCPRPDCNSASSVCEGIGTDSGSFKSCRSEPSTPDLQIDRPFFGSESPESKLRWSDPSNRQIKGAIVAERTPYVISTLEAREHESCRRSNSDQSLRGKRSVEHPRVRNRARHEVVNAPSIEVEASSVEALPLKATRKLDSEKSPVLSLTLATQESHPRTLQRRRSVLDRFGRKVWLHYNPDERINEVRLDEDGNYYVYGDAGLRIKLASGQVHDEDTSQPYCVSNGHKVNISKMQSTNSQNPLEVLTKSRDVVPDLIRKSMLRDRKAPSVNADIVPNTQMLPGKKKPPPSAPLGNVPVSSGQARASSSHGKAITNAPRPGSAVLKGVADKSKSAKTYSTMSGGSTASITSSVRMEREKKLRRARRRDSLRQAPGKLMRMITRKGG